MTKHTLTARIALLLTLAALVPLAAQSGGSGALLDVNKYFSYFPIKAGEDVADNDYVWTATGNDYDRFTNLGGHTDEIDTPLEFALLSYYSQPVINTRPIEAKEVLPANNPELADLKLGTATYMEMQMARFSGKDPALYAAALKFITARGKVSEADIKKFMAQGIAA
jgi:hypothetical protein